ncbi:MAG: hypothetical protein AB1Z22_08540 [Synechococcaceae cyanobacterium]
MERQGVPSFDRRRSRWFLGLTMPLALGLAACSGTPLGEQLGDSFPDGQPAAAGDPPTAQGPAGGGPAATPAAGAGAPQPPAAGPGAVPTPAATTPVAPQPAPAAAAVPYRLTLRLTGADPAAPAEAVTQALRAAGLAFEVEVIERIPEASGPPQPPQPTNAPAPAPTNP